MKATESDLDFYRRRETAERIAADCAPDSGLRALHVRFAKRYAGLLRIDVPVTG